MRFIGPIARLIDRLKLWSWLWVALAAIYFVLPLYGTLDFSLRARRNEISLQAYENVFKDAQFFGELKTPAPTAWRGIANAPSTVKLELGAFGVVLSIDDFATTLKLSDTIYRFIPGTFIYSNIMAVATILVSLLLIVPTAYWVHLRLPQVRPAIEFITLMPFVIPAIILVFGLIKMYSRPLEIGPVQFLPPLTNNAFGTNILLVIGYAVLSLPYMYRAVDNGLRAIDVRTLTEAAQSLGAGWPTILWQIIFPNLRTALLSGALLTFAIVVGEFTLATFLGRPAFGPYLWLLGQHQAYEPAALTILSFALTWSAMVLIQQVTRGQGQVSGAR